MNSTKYPSIKGAQIESMHFIMTLLESMKDFIGIVDAGGLVLYHQGISCYNTDEHLITL